MKSKIVFGSIAAQHDNLGDIVIRRIFFNAFLEKGNSLVLLTQKMPKPYVESFNLPGDVRYVSNPIKFQVELIKAALLGRASLVYAPGPHTLSDSPGAVAKAAVMLANAVLIRSTGGVIETAGRALRGRGRITTFLERRLADLMTTYVVRDSASEAVVGRSLHLAPDLALARKNADSSDIRKYVSCSFRSDTPVDVAAFSRLARQFTEAGYEVVMVSQVQRDDDQHEEIAKHLGLRAFLWGSRSHAEQLTLVDEVYAKSYAVISNRLHGLIFGITSGAIPVEYRVGKSDKIRTTLSPWIDSYPVFNQDRTDSAPDAGFMTQTELEYLIPGLASSATKARERVNDVLQGLSDSKSLYGAKSQSGNSPTK